MNWNKYTHDEIKRTIFYALEENISYESTGILGLLGTCLGRETFYEHALFLKDALLLLPVNTNFYHIECHTLTENNIEEVFQSVFNFK